jgi:hypothetical protein
MTRSRAHRAARRRPHVLRTAEPVVSAYIDRLRDRALDGHRCHRITVAVNTDTKG